MTGGPYAYEWADEPEWDYARDCPADVPTGDVHEIAVAVGRVLRDAFCCGGPSRPSIDWLAARLLAVTAEAQALADALREYQGQGEHTALRWQANELANTGAAHLRGAALSLFDLMTLPWWVTVSPRA